jgi:PPM family protein phosphatase
VTIRWEAAGGSDIGRVRKGNEDSFYLDERRGVFLVADGMGGHAAGEVASAIAAESVVDALDGTAVTPSDDLDETLAAAFFEAQRRIADCCIGDPRMTGMGTTLSVAVLLPTGDLHLAHIGDSRVYLQRGGTLVPLTRDHTWVQREVDAGRLPAEAARNHHLSHILTRVLTADDPPDPDLQRERLAPGDTVLLCSDGLHNMLDDPSLLDRLTAAQPPAETVARLIEAANRRGGTDNVTAIVVRIL